MRLILDEIDDVASAIGQSVHLGIDEIWGKDLLDRYGREKRICGKSLLRFVYNARKSNSPELKEAIFRNIVDNNGTPTTQPIWWLEPMFTVLEVVHKQNIVLRESMKRLAGSVARAEAIIARNLQV